MTCSVRISRLELEQFDREKRDRELRELRERELNFHLREEMIKGAVISPHWIDIHRR